MPHSPPSATPIVVLDTNTVLDWLVFRDARVAALAAAVEARQLCWVTCPSMRDELARTLSYRSLEKWNPDSEHTLAVFDALATRCATPPPTPLNLRCSDPDDQVFLDLALAQQATWLVSHDRALLRLARRTRPWGVTILRPVDWPGLPPAVVAAPSPSA